MHWVLIIPCALVGSAVAAGAATLAGLWPGPLGCDTAGAEHRLFGYQARHAAPAAGWCTELPSSC